MSPDRRNETPPTQFGVFYPRGYVVIAFKELKEAEAARQALLDGGYDPQDVFLSEAGDVLRHTTAHLKDASAVAKALGEEHSVEQRHQELASQGSSFLLAYAPSDLDTDRLMNVLRRFKVQLAHKYDRLSLRNLDR